MRGGGRVLQKFWIGSSKFFQHSVDLFAFEKHLVNTGVA